MTGSFSGLNGIRYFEVPLKNNEYIFKCVFLGKRFFPFKVKQSFLKYSYN